MFGSRRLAKRSIIGTRVCAPWTDGRYYPGVISATQTWPNGEEVFMVQFDDGYSKTLQDKDLIGAGFQTIQCAKLKAGQKVFITYNGREVTGTVENHDVIEDNVFLVVESNSEEIELDCKLEDVRLLPSRKSSRLQKQDTDYSKMADMPHSESKKRTVSQIIDVPAVKQRRRKISVSPDMDQMECGEEVLDVEDEKGGGGGGGGQRQEVMDERMAAMVLTSLSCSPVSPGFHHPINIDKNSGSSPLTNSSFGSSGIWGMKGSSSSSSGTPSLTPSPPQLSTSAPVSSGLFGTPPVDEGIDLDDTTAYFAADDISSSTGTSGSVVGGSGSGAKKRRASTRTVFRCTWPNCGRLYNTVNGIERHVRCEHLGPKQHEPGEEEELSDHEEEFYYTEVEVTVDTMTQTFADMYTSSPPPCGPGPAFSPPHVPVSASPAILPDHDYQKKSIPLSIPSSSSSSSPSPGSTTNYGSSYPGTLSINIPQLSRSLSWQTTAPRASKSSPSPKQLTSATSPMHKKSRSETKKCRKIYGMENRELWCTQCKWKKACTRFMD